MRASRAVARSGFSQKGEAEIAWLARVEFSANFATHGPLAHGEAELLSERISRLEPEERDTLRSVTPLLRRLADPAR